jgi:hypothetical protein
MTANVRLKSAIEAAHFSQETLARKIQEAGYKYGYPNGCNRGTVHRWLDGAQPQPHYVLLLEATLGQPAADLGIAYERYEMDREQMLADAGLDVLMPEPAEDTGVVYGPLTGIWLSEYSFPSSSRQKTYTSRHYVLILQRGKGLIIRSLPEQESTLALDLTVNGKMTKGNWTEITSGGGYYQGAVYDGTIQMEINQAGDRMKGKWLGFGRDPGEINDGPWAFTRVSSDYGRESRRKWDVAPPAAEE